MSIDHQALAETTAMKAASAVSYGAAGGTALFASLTPGDWQIIGIIFGMALGAATFAVNALFRWLNYQIARERLAALEGQE